MELICPECMGTVQSGDGRAARCTVHGGEFKILFLREPVAPPPGAVMPVMPAATVEAGAMAMSTEGAPPAPPVVSGVPRPSEMRCVQHPGVAATQQCQMCGAYMCATCDFALPDGRHLCPPCATKPQPALGPKRKKAMIWSFVCAAAGTLGFVASLGYAATVGVETEAEQNALGVVMMLVVLVPSIAGVGVGLGAIDRRYRNPPSLWAATIWNGVLLGIFVLMTIIGNFS